MVLTVKVPLLQQTILNRFNVISIQVTREFIVTPCKYLVVIVKEYSSKI